MATYEDRLGADVGWALAEGSRHFEDKSAVHDTLRRLAARLDSLGVAYAVAGGMALFVHGYRRFTEGIDLVVSREGLRRIHESLEGLGYVPAFAGATSLRDATSGVRVEFLVTGDYPGDGRPKPVAFPDPAAVAIERDGVRYLNLPKLVELKLASGMTNARDSATCPTFSNSSASSPSRKVSRKALIPSCVPGFSSCCGPREKTPRRGEAGIGATPC